MAIIEVKDCELTIGGVRISGFTEGVTIKGASEPALVRRIDERSGTISLEVKAGDMDAFLGAILSHHSSRYWTVQRPRWWRPRWRRHQRGEVHGRARKRARLDYKRWRRYLDAMLERLVAARTASMQGLLDAGHVVAPEPMPPGHFRCEMCGIVDEKAWSDDEARAEAVAKGIDPDQSGVVCDDCYKKTPWGSEPNG